MPPQRLRRFRRPATAAEILRRPTRGSLRPLVPLAYLMGLSGLAYLAQGRVVGDQGFSGSDTILILCAWALSLAWLVGLVAFARRMPSSADRAVGS